LMQPCSKAFSSTCEFPLAFAAFNSPLHPAPSGGSAPAMLTPKTTIVTAMIATARSKKMRFIKRYLLSLCNPPWAALIVTMPANNRDVKR
jgi:hypothetical protein